MLFSSSFQIAIFALALISSQRQCDALFCDDDWCVEPRCSCEDVFPGLRSFFEDTFGVQTASRKSPLSDCFPQTGNCRQGFSGRKCECGFSRTNIADNSWLIPDSMKGSLTLTKTGSASGAILAGTWQAGYEASTGNPSQFTAWFDDDDDENENAWSVGKTASGNELIGSHSWIQLRKPGETGFRTVLNIGTQGGFVVTGNTVFAGTFDGLYLSTDGGETWLKSPADCEPYNYPSDEPTQSPGSGPPKPPPESKYCDAPVTHLFLLEDGSLIAFYMGYGGAHHIQLQDGDDPLLPESWVALPSFQDTQTCQSAFCHTYDAAILGNYMYVAFQSLPMVRIDLRTREAWEQVTVGTDSVSGNDLQPTAMTTVDGGSRLFVSTSDGLYHTSDGVTWTRVPDEACSNRNTPPLPSRGMVSVKDSSTGATVIVFGTVLGPWVYKE